MSENAEFRSTEAGGVDNTGVGEFVQDQDVVLAGEGANGAQGGSVAGGEGERGGSALEGGEKLLEFVVGRERTADEAGGG